MNGDEIIKKTVLEGRELNKTEESCLCIMAKKSYELIPEQQELLKQGLIFRLTKNDARALLSRYIRTGRKLAPENQLRLFEAENPEDLLRSYFHTWSLCEAAETKLFELDPSGKLAVAYSHQSAFDEKPEVIFMTLPGILEDQKLYVSRGPLAEKTRERLLETKDGAEFIRQELKLRRKFSDSVQVKMMTSAHAKEFMRAYTVYAPLCEEAQCLISTLRKPKKMYRVYASRHKLCDRAEKIADSYGWT